MMTTLGGVPVWPSSAPAARNSARSTGSMRAIGHLVDLRLPVHRFIENEAEQVGIALGHLHALVDLGPEPVVEEFAPHRVAALSRLLHLVERLHGIEPGRRFHAVSARACRGGLVAHALGSPFVSPAMRYSSEAGANPTPLRGPPHLRASATRCKAAAAAPAPLFMSAGSARASAWARVSTVRMPLPMHSPCSPRSISPRELSLQTVS